MPLFAIASSFLIQSILILTSFIRTCVTTWSRTPLDVTEAARWLGGRGARLADKTVALCDQRQTPNPPAWFPHDLNRSSLAHGRHTSKLRSSYCLSGAWHSPHSCGRSSSLPLPPADSMIISSMPHECRNVSFHLTPIRTGLQHVRRGLRSIVGRA
jgi:hypothetical protein